MPRRRPGRWTCSGIWYRAPTSRRQMPIPADGGAPTTKTAPVSHEAEAFLSLLWRHIYTRVQSMLHPHHMKHEPGGSDIVKLPLGFLKDVVLTAPGNGDALIYESASKHWINGAGGGGGGQAFFEMTNMVVPITVPGPTNLTGGTLTITHVLIKSDGQCAGSAAGQAFSFGAGGGTSDNDGLSTAWADGSSISATVSSVGAPAATYLTVDAYFVLG